MLMDILPLGKYKIMNCGNSFKKYSFVFIQRGDEHEAEK